MENGEVTLIFEDENNEKKEEIFGIPTDFQAIATQFELQESGIFFKDEIKKKILSLTFINGNPGKKYFVYGSKFFF